MTVRVRVTLAAVLVVGLALVAGALVLVGLLGSVLTDQVCADARERATRLASTVAVLGAEVEPSTSSELVQVVDRSGAVVGAPEARRLADPGARCVAVEPPGYSEDLVFAAAAVPEAGDAGAVQGSGAILPARQLLSAVLLMDDFGGERAGYLHRKAKPGRLVGGIRAWSPLDLQCYQRHTRSAVVAEPAVADSSFDVERGHMQLAHAVVTHKSTSALLPKSRPGPVFRSLVCWSAAVVRPS